MNLSDDDLTYLKRLYDHAPVSICVVNPQDENQRPVYANPAFDRGDYKIAPAKNIDSQTTKLTLDSRLSKGPAAFQVTELRLKGYHGPLYILWELIEKVDTASSSNTFLTTMSHEIRSPMQAVFGMMELIGAETSKHTDIPSRKISPMIETAKSSASNVLEILDDVLDLAKMNADMFDLDHYEIPLRTLVSGITEALQVKTIDTNVELKQEIDESVPAVVKGDPKRLRQVLMNLCSNALKFTKEGSVTVRIDNLSKNPDAKHVILRFEVIDTGIGIDPQTQKKLFRPFVQADSTTSRKYGGTGLGLSITNKLVEMMGGQIGIESEEGKGSCFWFEIPTSSVPIGSENDPESTLQRDLLDGIKILSVEDHPSASKEIKNSLESVGCAVTSVANLTEARKALANKAFDASIIDQGLPDGLGVDLIREIAQAYPSMELIMYTARQDKGLEYTLKTLGATYLSKPASRQGLISTIKSLVKIDHEPSINGTGKVLLVDDTPAVAEVFRQQFKNLNVSADFASSGKDALDKMKQSDYDMIITDFHMPEMDGVELATKVRSGKLGLKTSSNTPIIALSADISIAQKESHPDIDFQECLLKPVTLAQLSHLFFRWGILNANPKDKKKSTKATKSEVREKPVKSQGAQSGDILHIDFDALKERVGAADKDAKHILTTFIKMTTPRVEELQTAYDNRDIQKISDLAHSLKGAALSACAPKLAELGESLQAINENTYPNAFPLLREIETEINEIQKTVENL